MEQFLALISFVVISGLPGGSSAKTVIQKELNEEPEIGTIVADIKRDANLDSDFNHSTMATLRFRFLVGPQDDQQYFGLDSTTGIIRTLVRIDRDQICPGLDTCFITRDVAIQPPHFRVLKLVVTILDENDNVPRFPAPVLKAAVSESTQPGPFYPVPLAEDPDSPGNSVVHYAMQPNSDKFGLHVVKSDGGSIQDVQLVLKDVLDREKKDSYQVKVYAYDGGSPPKSGSVVIEIQVTDENDHRPEFERSTYEMEIVENSPPKKSLLTVRASDSDSGPNGVVRYKFSSKTSSTYGSLFSIDSESGQISLLRALDFEQYSQITLEVLAQDQGPGSSPVMAKVIVNVRDINDNAPQIRMDPPSAPEGEKEDGKQYAHVIENSANGTYVVQLTINDPDGGDSGKVQCVLHQADKSKADHFRLVELYEKEFALMTNGQIDRERIDRYDLAVTCKDSGRLQLTSTLDMVVIVDDLNDNTPKFSHKEYDVRVKENIGTMEVILQVTATDPDASENGTVTYTMSNADAATKETFHIDRKRGAIWATKALDRERKDIFRFLVVASDGLPDQNDAKSSTSTVIIHVTDVNDEVPRFQQTRYNFSVFENQNAKTQVGLVAASDPDLTPGNQFTYYLDQATCPLNLFRIDSKTGWISTKATLNREEKESYEFKVMVRDDGLPGAPPESATITVYVRDENDNSPTIYFPGAGNDTVYIPNTVPVGHLVTTVIARDPDDGDNSRLTYVISGGNQKGVFGIDPQTGDLFVNSLLSDDEDEMVKFSLQLTVQDAGSPQRMTKATLQVVISAASHLHAASGLPTGSFRLAFTDTHLAVIVGIIGGCLIIGVALIVAVCFVKRRRKLQKNRPNDIVPGSSGTLANVKYVPTGNGLSDDHSVGTGSGPSYMRESIGLPDDLAADDGFVIVNCTHPGDSVTSQMAFDRRSRLYSPKPDGGKCQQCDDALNQLHLSCSRHPPLCTASDFARYTTAPQRPMYTPIDYNQAIFNDSPSSGLPITSPDWTVPHQRKPSFSQWLNSESFHLKQRAQAYNVTDYGTLGRSNGIGTGVRNPGGDYVSSLVDPPRNVIMTCHDGIIKATPTPISRQISLLGKHVSSPNHVNVVSNQMAGSMPPEMKNHVISSATAHA